VNPGQTDSRFIFNSGRTDCWHQIMLSVQALVVGKVYHQSRPYWSLWKYISRHHLQCAQCLFCTFSDRALNGGHTYYRIRISATIRVSADIGLSLLTSGGQFR